MEIKQQFEETMNSMVNMALATSVEGTPNVRVVSFAYDNGHLYFTTFKGNQKVRELAQNPAVACMPLPEKPEANVQVRIFGRAQKADKSLDEIIEIIARKYPEGSSTIKNGGPMMEIYEVCIDKAFVTLGMSEAVEVKLN